MEQTERGYKSPFLHSKELLGLDEYTRELSRILRELLAAGSKRDFDKMLELANDIENLVIDER